MIVDHDDSRSGLRDGGAEDLAWVHERAVEESPGDEDLSQHPALAVEREEMELLDLKIPEARREPAYVPWSSFSVASERVLCARSESRATNAGCRLIALKSSRC